MRKHVCIYTFDSQTSGGYVESKVEIYVFFSNKKSTRRDGKFVLHVKVSV